jgi:hypothetical protein
MEWEFYFFFFFSGLFNPYQQFLGSPMAQFQAAAHNGLTQHPLFGQIQGGQIQGLRQGLTIPGLSQVGPTIPSSPMVSVTA